MSNTKIFSNHAEFYFFLKRNPYLMLKNQIVSDFKQTMNSLVSGCKCNTNKMQKMAIEMYKNINVTEEEKIELKETLGVEIIKFNLGIKEGFKI